MGKGWGDPKHTTAQKLSYNLSGKFISLDSQPEAALHYLGLFTFFLLYAEADPFGYIFIRRADFLIKIPLQKRWKTPKRITTTRQLPDCKFETLQARNPQNFMNTIEIEKGGAVPYRDIVTILRLASMQYITRQASDCYKARNPGPPPPKYKVIYTVDASVRSVKIFPVHKIVLTGPWQNAPPCKVPMSIYSYIFALKPIKFTYMEMKIFESSFSS
jgi:hypothetical protein